LKIKKKIEKSLEKKFSSLLRRERRKCSRCISGDFPLKSGIPDKFEVFSTPGKVLFHLFFPCKTSICLALEPKELNSKKLEKVEPSDQEDQEKRHFSQPLGWKFLRPVKPPKLDSHYWRWPEIIIHLSRSIF